MGAGRIVRRALRHAGALRPGHLWALPRTLDYVGEFGPELVTFLPFCQYLSEAGLLRTRRIGTYRGMRCFYERLDCAGIIEKPGPRNYVAPAERPAWLPRRDEHDFDGAGPSPHLRYPDLRAWFSARPLVPELDMSGGPLLIIHNKHNDEWAEGPVNVIGLPALDALLRRVKERFTVVYIRHGMGGTGQDAPDYSRDHNTARPFDDAGVLAGHPEVLVFDRLLERHRDAGGTDDLNTFKNTLYSLCHRFISVQGGGAHHIAMFSGSVLAVLHRRGMEERWAYADGYYGFMAPVPPVLAITGADTGLLGLVPLLEGARVLGGRVMIDPAQHMLAASHSARAFAASRPGQ